MLGVKTYTQDYVDRCRAKVESDVAAYGKLAAAAPKGPALAEFEARFFNNLVLVLDACFVHRLRTVEGKDGNALNEVRVICTSLLENNGVLAAEKSIKLSPAKSVLKREFGEKIELTEADFSLLSTAFFAEMERKYL